MDTLDPEPEERAEAEHLAAGRKAAHAVLELCGVLLFAFFFVTTTRKLFLYLWVYLLTTHGGSKTESTVFAIALVVATLLGVLAADLIAGTVHWAADNWGSEDLPVVGGAFIRPFRHHHVDPASITRHDFLELNGNNFIVSLLPLWLASSALPSPSSSPTARGHDAGAASLATAIFWLSFALCVALTNQVHCWAHMRDPPPR